MKKDPEILAQTAHWVVISKPPFWLTIPGRDSTLPVLSQWVENHFSKIWVVHRLDRETSGVILFARTPDAHQEANSWFQNRKVQKTYHFLASGRPTMPIFKVSQPIEKAPSTTQFEVLETYPEGFFGKAKPLTGRRHQIRIHLASKGFPIWGDVQYQGSRNILSGIEINRVALHASELQLPSGEKFSAALPKDMEDWLNAVKNGGQSGGI